MQTKKNEKAKTTKNVPIRTDLKAGRVVYAV
jgi:hypothetical protein